VKKIDRAQVAAFYRRTYSPQGAVLYFVGDIQPDVAAALARKALASWKGNPWTPLDIPGVGAIKGPQILLVDKADATQAQVRVTVPGISRNDPAYYGAVVANTVLGGGFTSRLVDEIRVNQGLSYSVSTRVVALRKGGAISYSTFTQTDTVRKILDASFKVLSEFHDKGPTNDEVEKAKRYVIGLYPGRVESIDQLAEALAMARLNGLPFSSVEEYRGRIGAIDQSSAAAVSQLFPVPSASKIVIVGNASKIKPQLTGLGTVTAARVKDFE
jgi:zinc protease